LLNDRHCGIDWYLEPHLSAKIQVKGRVVKVNGGFWHRKYSCMSMAEEPFKNLTCSICALIPLQNDFKMRIIREDFVVTKRGHRSTTSGIRLGYLSTYKVNKHTRNMSKQLRLKKLHYWHARTRFVQLKARRPTLRESAKNAASDNNLIKFCNNIISVYRIGPLEGSMHCGTS